MCHFIFGPNNYVLSDGNRNSSVGIATGLIAGRPKIRGVRFHVGVADIPFLHIGLADSGTIQWASGVFFWVIKGPGREASSSAEVNA
jgi:hypothetical protein